MEVPALELIDVHTALGESWVLRGVNLAVPAGRITVLLGPSGVGKTTCVKHIVGLLDPDVGDVLVEGRSLRAMGKSERAALQKRFGVLLQGSGLSGSALWGSMTVRENLMFQLRSLCDLPEDQLLERTLERLREVGLAKHAERLPAELSAGMARRAGLARALASDPDIAVLDSFDLGIDKVRLGHLCELIRRRRAATGATYLVTTHDMEVARSIADEVVVLWDGRVVEAGPADRVFGSGVAEVRQLVAGAETGPLQMRSEARVGASPREVSFDLPLPLGAIVTLAVVTASVLVLGSGDRVELVVLVSAWVAVAVLLTRRR